MVAANSSDRAGLSTRPPVRNRLGAAFVGAGRAAVRPPTLAIVATVIGLFLRVWNLPGLGDFDFDEVASVWYARLDTPEVFRAIRNAPFEHPPLYYVTLHFWNQVFGESEPLVRLLSLPAGVLVIPVTYAIGARLFDRRAAALASLIVAASPTLIFYSREARMYIFATLFGLLSVYLLLRAFHGGGPLPWAGYVLVSAVGPFLDYTALLGVLAGDVYLISNWKRNPRAALFLLVAQMAGVAALLAWMLTSPGVLKSLPAFGTGTLTYGLLSHTAREGWLNLTTGIGNIRGGRASLGVAVLLGLAGLAGFVWSAWRRRGTILHAYVAFAIVAVLVLLAFGQDYQPRYLMIGIPLLALFAGYAVSRLPLPYMAIAGAVAIVFAMGPLYASRYYYFDYQRGDYRSITATIKSLALPMADSETPGKFRDAVVLAGPWQGWFWRHYFPGFLDTVDVWLLPERVPPAVTWEEVDAKLSRAAEIHQRLWVVLSALRQSDPNGFVETWLNTRLWKARDSAYRNGMLLLYMSDAAGMVIRDDGLLSLPLGPRIESIEFAGEREGQPPKEAGNGIRFTIRLFADGPVTWKPSIRAWLVGPDGKVYERIFRPLAQDGRRPENWIPGERIHAKTAVWIPAGAVPGRYEAFASFLDADLKPIPVKGRLEGVFQDQPGILRLGPVDVVPSSLGLPDDAEIAARFGGPLHERTMEDVENRSIYRGSLHER